MFITEAQLALYKYQAGGKYYQCPMSHIAQQEFIEFSKISSDADDVIKCFSHFWNRRVISNVWEVLFSDNSSLLIRKILKDGKITYEFKGSDIPENFDFNSIFSH